MGKKLIYFASFVMILSPAVLGNIIVNDNFDDGAIGTNAAGIGTGFNTVSLTGGSVTESDSSAHLNNTTNGAARAGIASKEGAVIGAVTDRFEFRGISFAQNTGNTGTGTTGRTAVGVRGDSTAEDVDSGVATGFWIQFESGDIGETNASWSGTSTLFYESSSGVKTVLATWKFNTLNWDDNNAATMNLTPVLDITLDLSPAGYSLTIEGDTISNVTGSLSGSYASAGITNEITEGYAFAFNQGEAPGLNMSIDQIVITEGVSPPVLASDPSPSDGEEDVVFDTELSWSPGIYAVTHDVYLGTDFDDVNSATIANPLSTTVVEGHDVNNYNPGGMEWAMTYYWRVDEVNDPANPGTYKGNVWNFTVEPYAYKLPGDRITVTASSSSSGYEPNDMINEAGLDPNTDEHSSSQGMWLSGTSDPNTVWIQFDFDKLYKLYDMLVWNFNKNLINSYGFKEVRIEYSEDGQTWTIFPDANEFSKAPGKSSYANPDTVMFDGLVAKAVRITALSNWGTAKKYGLSEVRFNYVPVRARIPSPVVDEKELAVDTELGWRAGREADKHYLYISTDVNSVTANLVDPVILDEASYSPNLALGQTYYWKVDEVNNAEVPSVWDGPVWSFSTVSVRVIDNFEVGYNDTDANAVWATWVDGYGDNSNGSQMGFDYPGPYLSTLDPSGSGHSAPLIFDNTGTATKSEVTAQSLDLPIASTNWSLGSPKTLVIWFYGDPNNIVSDSQMYCTIGGKTATYNGSLDLLKRGKWYQWDIDLDTLGANLSNIPQITIGIKNAGATPGKGTIYLDDIELAGVVPVYPSIYIEAENADSITTGMSVQTTTAGYLGTGYIASDPEITDNQTTDPPTAGIATYTFDITETGLYRIAFRDYVLTDAGTVYNSWWVKVTGPNVAGFDGWANFNEIPAANGWTWVDVWNGTGSPITYTISEPGTYTIQVAYRERGNRLDAIEIRKTGELP